MARPSSLTHFMSAGRLRHVDYVDAHKALQAMSQQAEAAQQWRSHCQTLFPRSTYFQR